MCGRFAQISPAHILRKIFRLLADLPEIPPRYNIAPGQNIYVIRDIVIREEQQQTSETPEFKRELSQLKWGLIPFWAEDSKIGSRFINARAESAAKKEAYRVSFRNRRCLIPADGFYEWETQFKGRKQPFFVRPKNDQPFALAGLWDRWEDPMGGTVIESCTILTTEANELLKPIHKRMPAIISPDNYDLWLNPTMNRPDRLNPLLQPFESSAMIIYPVSSYANNSQNEGPKCIKKQKGIGKQQKLF
ncbi:MAG: hypothetical protein GF308_08870 [Candidatus Heimdallarchaeota archaeon]|nr:hypothetical protein [Candidatus Heimdallarchaeota archaeon]